MGTIKKRTNRRATPKQAKANLKKIKDRTREGVDSDFNRRTANNFREDQRKSEAALRKLEKAGRGKSTNKSTPKPRAKLSLSKRRKKK
jgi:hypothetical protein